MASPISLRTIDGSALVAIFRTAVRNPRRRRKRRRLSRGGPFAPRRHRTVALRQDCLHYCARPSSDARACGARRQGSRRQDPASGVSTVRRRPHRFGASRPAARLQRAALRLRRTSRGARRRGPALAAVDAPHFRIAGKSSNIARKGGRCARASTEGRRDSISTLSTTPANGCSICRCLANPTRSGPRRRSRRRALLRAR